MLNLHLSKDRGTIVRHRDFTIRGYENLVQALRCEFRIWGDRKAIDTTSWSQGSPDDVGDCSRGKNV